MRDDARISAKGESSTSARTRKSPAATRMLTAAPIETPTRTIAASGRRDAAYVMAARRSACS